MIKSINPNKPQRTLRLIFIFLILISFIAVISEIFNQRDITVDEKTAIKSIEFHHVGYYKSVDNLRYFTVYATELQLINRDTFPEEVAIAITNYGSKQMHTDGRITATFFYADKASTPDITLLDAQTANQKAHDADPFASVWIMPNGEINLILNPNRDK